MLKKALSAEFEVKEAADGIGVFDGIASTPDVDLSGDIVKSGAFGDIAVKNIPMLWAHDMRSPIGGWKAIETKGGKLHVQGELNLEVAKGQEVYALMRKGHVSGLSVGFFPQPGHVKYDDKTGVRTIAKARLVEISVVPVPANDKARAKQMKSADGLAELAEFKSALVDDYGFSDEEADIIITKGYAALVNRPAGDEPADLSSLSAELKGIREALKGSPR